MGVITVKIDDELERMFRARAYELYGLSRGTLSKAFEAALSLWIRSTIPEESRGVTFSAYRGDEKLAEGSSLKALADRLREMRVDPREIQIVSSRPLREAERLGMRTTRIER